LNFVLNLKNKAIYEINILAIANDGDMTNKSDAQIYLIQKEKYIF
jgi:hypothetical protein